MYCTKEKKEVMIVECIKLNIEISVVKFKVYFRMLIKKMHCLMSVNWISVNSLIIKINLFIWLDDNLFEQYKFNN